LGAGTDSCPGAAPGYNGYPLHRGALRPLPDPIRTARLGGRAGSNGARRRRAIRPLPELFA
jgi:hypothetical protein